MKNVTCIDVRDELTQSYLNYAMSVIVGRALPDVRDGLKPVHRRVLYVMKELGNYFDKNYKKSARVVGDVMGKYHPHGELAIYDSIVRLAQSFVQRYALIDGQGNFGSIDGDSPAAMRYTEIRLSEFASFMLNDLDFDTVDYVSNYDNTESQPVVLPSMFPNLLVNGASGIAVGMATNIPPHNISEVINGCLAVIDDPHITIDELMNIILGPDFPTYATIYGTSGIVEAYKTGKGKICIKARASIIHNEITNRDNIIISELPYQINKLKLVEKVALLMREKRIEGIRVLRDESDKDGLRIFIDIHKGKNSGVILNKLYSLTSLQSTYGINMVALVNGLPKLLNLKKVIDCFIDHRREIIYRRTNFKLYKAKSRAHVLEGLCIALLNLDVILVKIKVSDSLLKLKKDLSSIIWNGSKINDIILSVKLDLCDYFGEKFNGILSAEYKFTDIQIQAILDLKLYKIMKLEKNDLFCEYKDVLYRVKQYTDILNNSNILMDIVKNELIFIKSKFGDVRKTKIVPITEKIDELDLIVKEDIIVTLSYDGYIKSQLLSMYHPQRRGGKGKIATQVKINDFIFDFFITDTHSILLCFSNYGRVYWVDLYKFSMSGRNAKGVPIVNLLRLKELEKINAILPVDFSDADSHVIMVTKNGLVKKLLLSEFKNLRKNGLIVIDLLKNDTLVDVKLIKLGDEIILFANSGRVIRFMSDNIRCTRRASKGVIGMRLIGNSHVISLVKVVKKGHVLAATKNGYGKRTCVEEYPLTQRGGKGVIGIKVDKKNGEVVKVELVFNKDELMLITNKGIVVRIRVNEVSCVSRNTKGVILINLSSKERLVSIKKIN